MMHTSQPMGRVVTLHTSEGPISIELYDAEAPVIAENFYQLASRGHLDRTQFHRVIPGFIAQGGDWDGKGGESIAGHWLDDEITPSLRHTGAGVVSSASAGKDMNGSQFFITLSPQPTLDGRYTIFGRVSFGMDALERINHSPVDSASQKPFKSIVITHCTVATLPRQRRPQLSRKKVASNTVAVENKRPREVEDNEEVAESEGTIKCLRKVNLAVKQSRSTRGASLVERLSYVASSA